MNTPLPKWHRRYLPHCDTRLHFQSITFRLADSLPRETLRALEEELALLPDEQIEAERRRRIEAWLDSGIGCCALRNPRVAALVQDALLRFDGDRYDLVAWCIMPNHVHVLIRPVAELSKIVQSWKSFTGRRAMEWNSELELGVPGKAFWMREYWDRFIRDERHFHQVVDYIHRNPVKAGLCDLPEDWPWSSAAAEGSDSGNSTDARKDVDARIDVDARKDVDARAGARGSRVMLLPPGNAGLQPGPTTNHGGTQEEKQKRP